MPPVTKRLSEEWAGSLWAELLSPRLSGIPFPHLCHQSIQGLGWHLRGRMHGNPGTCMIGTQGHTAQSPSQLLKNSDMVRCLGTQAKPKIKSCYTFFSQCDWNQASHDFPEPGNSQSTQTPPGGYEESMRLSGVQLGGWRRIIAPLLLPSTSTVLTRTSHHSAHTRMCHFQRREPRPRRSPRCGPALPPGPRTGFPTYCISHPTARQPSGATECPIPGPHDLQAQGFHQPVFRKLHGNFRFRYPTSVSEPSGVEQSSREDWERPARTQGEWSHVRGRGLVLPERSHRPAMCSLPP